MNENCRNCKFWQCRYDSIEEAMSIQECDSDKAIDFMNEGMCRRYPARFFVVEDNTTFNNNFRVFGERSDFFTQPSTQSYDWCGEFKSVNKSPAEPV